MVVLIILLGSSVVGTVQSTDESDAPAVPASYYGDITLDGDPAPAGTTVEARINDEVRGMIVIDEDGEYGGPAAADEKLTVDGTSDDDGEEITFHIDTDGSGTGEADQTSTWKSGSITELELTATLESEDGEDGNGENGNGGTGSSGGSSGSSSGGGGGGGGGGVSPTASITTGIEDMAPQASGTTIEANNVDDIDAITLGAEDAAGTISIDGYERPPSSAPDMGGQPTITAVNIDVPDSYADTPATLQFTIRNQQLLRAGVEQEELTVLRGMLNGYERLDTGVVGETNSDVTIEAETPGFSTFVVTGEGTDAAFAEDDTEQEPEPDSDPETASEPDSEADTEPDRGDETSVNEPDDQAGFGVVVALVALLAVTLLARRLN